MQSLMAPAKTYPLADRALKGRLAEMLTTARTAGESYEQIARKLSTVRGVEVSSATVRRWCMELGIEAGSAA